jgi:KilA-N domain
MPDTIIISSEKIKINSEGLYCINDLHKASGKEDRHTPWRWFRSEKVTDLKDEILKHQKWAIKKESGRYGGTFVCRELVYAYAMWISPKFHIDVIKFFDRNKTVQSNLQSLVGNVRSFGKDLRAQMDDTSLTIDEMNQHGSNWGHYGASIRKAKKECRQVLEEIKDEIQMKLDFK